MFLSKNRQVRGISRTRRTPSTKRSLTPRNTTSHPQISHLCFRCFRQRCYRSWCCSIRCTSLGSTTNCWSNSPSYRVWCSLWRRFWWCCTRGHTRLCTTPRPFCNKRLWCPLDSDKDCAGCSLALLPQVSLSIGNRPEIRRITERRLYFGKNGFEVGGGGGGGVRARRDKDGPCLCGCETQSSVFSSANFLRDAWLELFLKSCRET